jgi:hypothetical protein
MTINGADLMLISFSVSDYKFNTVTVVHSENSTTGGGDEGSSTIDVRSTNFKMYNINVENSFGAGTQVKKKQNPEASACNPI